MNNQKLLNSFNDYLEELIKQEHASLENATSVVFINRSQGKIQAFKRLMYLREEVNNAEG